MTHHKAPSTAWQPCLPCVMLAPGGTPPGPGCLHSPPFLEGFDSGVPASRRCEGSKGLNPRKAHIPAPRVGGKVNSAYLLVPPGRGSPGCPWRHQSLVPLAAPVCLATQWIAVPTIHGTSRSHEGQQDWAKGIYNPRGSGDQISTWQLPAGELWRWKQNKGARVLEYSWTKGILEHSQLDHFVRTGPQLSLHLSPTLPSCAQGSLIKDSPKYWQACHSGIIPAHYPPATRALCFYSPSRGVVRGKECDRQGRQDTLHWDLCASLLLTPTRRIGVLLEMARTLLKGHSAWLMAEMVPMRHLGAHK